VEAVAERMADHLVGHHPTMPGAGKKNRSEGTSETTSKFQQYKRL
jgi:hypothetical protein